MAGIAGAGAIAAVVGIWHLPARMYPNAGDSEARAALQGGLLTAAAALTAVAGGLIALDETRQANAEVRRANENTHVRELYATAIGLLSAETIDSRLGGIYALERVAVDSPADQRTVVEVLSAFVRVHSTDPALRPTTPDPASPVRPAVDVHAAVTVLARLPVRDGVPRADLLGANLTGPASLRRLQIPGGNLDGTNLNKADLSSARLEKVSLVRASLNEATLADVRMAGANLAGAMLSETNLTGARMAGVNLTGAWLIGANFTRARLVGAKFSGARMDGTILLPDSLRILNIRQAVFKRADLTDVRGLTQEQINAAGGDRWTVLPTGLARPASWIEEEPPPTV